MKTTKIGLVLLAFVQPIGTTCSSHTNEHIRRYTYPPGFEYLDTEHVETTMWKIARNTRDLNALLHAAGPFTSDKQAQVDAHLASLDTLIAELPTGGALSHPLLGQNIVKFREDVRAARMNAAAEPPNLYLAGSIAGACGYCHGPGYPASRAPR